MKTRRKILIGGIQRSGTTLLATSVARTFAALVVPEAQFKPALLDPGSTPAEKLQSLYQSFRFRIWSLDHVPLASSPESGAQLFDAIVAEAEAQFSTLPVADVIVDHTPDNIAHAELLDGGYDPEVFLYICRDPRPTVLSIMRTDWGFPSVRSAVAFWRRRYEHDLRGLEYLWSTAPERVRVVRYEDLCRDPDTTLHEALGDLPLRKNTGGCSTVLVPQYTTSQHGRLFQTAQNRQNWRTAFSEAEAAYIVEASSHAFFAPDYYRDDPKATEAAVPQLGLADRLREMRKPLDHLRARGRRNRRGISAVVL